MPVRVGVIGAGIMGADHIRNLSSSIGGAEVTFVADLDAGQVVAADADIVAATGASLLSLGFMRRLDPGYVALRRSVQDRAQGEPLVVHCTSRNAGAGPGTTSESAITNSAIHS